MAKSLDESGHDFTWTWNTRIVTTGPPGDVTSKTVDDQFRYWHSDDVTRGRLDRLEAKVRVAHPLAELAKANARIEALERQVKELEGRMG